MIDVDLEWHFVDPQLDDDTDGGYHVDLPSMDHDTNEMGTTDWQVVGSGRKRIFHPNKGVAKPGGLNHLQRMDRDQHAHIRNHKNLYYPFACKSEWEFANWLSSGSLSQREIDQYLRSIRVSKCFVYYYIKKNM